MSFLIQGPYPGMKTTLLLPSPRLTNNRGNAATVQTMRAMDSTVYTYIKSKRARQAMSWDFVTSRDKGLEAKQFMKEYAVGEVRVQDHRGNQRVGWVTINPVELRGAGGNAVNWGKNEEVVSFTIEFEERV